MSKPYIRNYTLPEVLPGETNWAWCQRAAASMPAEALMREVVEHFREEGRWLGNKDDDYAHARSSLGEILGDGSGVSAAIVERFTGDKGAND